MMREASFESSAGLICSELSVAIEHLVDAGDRVPRDRADLLSNAAGVVQSRDAGMAQGADGEPRGGNAHWVGRVVLDGIRSGKALVTRRELTPQMVEG